MPPERRGAKAPRSNSRKASFPIEEVTQRDEDLWFEDGNVDILAQSIVFRVHQSVLARHSVIFADLFTVPQPAPLLTQDASLRRIPSVKVSDSSHDFRELLRAMYGGLR